MVRHPPKSGAKPRSGQAEKKPLRTERIAKALARAGVASRREVERLINLGKVAVNGKILDTPATLVTRDDILTVDGEVVNAPEATRLWRYHKPVGLMTTHKDPEDRATVFEHLPEGLPRVISVGRLDLSSEGLLLLTNDGSLARALELPANAWRRVYRARALGRTTQAKLDALKDGITVEGVHYGAIEAKLDKAQEKDDGRANVWITLTITEGKNREVRRVLEALGLKVNRLMRLAYGPFQLGTLAAGEVEEVGPRVIREQLAEFIAPESLPTGDRTLSAPPVAEPARRPGAAAAKPANAMADPRKKPSRVRAQVARAEASPKFGDDRPAKPFRPAKPKPGRAHAATKGYFGDKKSAGPRAGGAGKPPRAEGAKRGPRSDSAGRSNARPAPRVVGAFGGGAPDRDAAPRAERSERPASRAAKPYAAKSHAAKPRAAGGFGSGEAAPRPERSERAPARAPRAGTGGGFGDKRPERAERPARSSATDAPRAFGAGAARGNDRTDAPREGRGGKPAGRGEPRGPSAFGKDKRPPSGGARSNSAKPGGFKAGPGGKPGGYKAGGAAKPGGFKKDGPAKAPFKKAPFKKAAFNKDGARAGAPKSGAAGRVSDRPRGPKR
jgi:23S rRNA pseudouridine2605 synthase